MDEVDRRADEVVEAVVARFDEPEQLHAAQATAAVVILAAKTIGIAASWRVAAEGVARIRIPSALAADEINRSFGQTVLGQRERVTRETQCDAGTNRMNRFIHGEFLLEFRL